MPAVSDAIRISLTQFFNFVTKQPEKQLTVVREIRKQHEIGYDVPPDLYKQFRDGVGRYHKNGWPKARLDAIATSQTEPARVTHYPPLVQGYKKFLGRKAVTWFDPGKGAWNYAGLTVGTSPELGLIWDDQRYLVKMYLNQGEDLNKRRAEIICHLLKLAMPHGDDLLIPAVLDVRKGKLFPLGKSDHEQTILLRSQAKAFVEMYQGL